MYYNNEVIQGNIHVFDSYDMDISPTKGDNCFLIVHHFTDKSIIDKLAKNLLQNGYKYFKFTPNIAGSVTPRNPDTNEGIPTSLTLASFL